MNNKVEIEKLENQLASTRKGTEKYAELLVELAWEVGFPDHERAKVLNQEGLDLANEKGYERAIAIGNRNRAMMYYVSYEGDVEESLSLLLDSLKWFEDHDEFEEQASVNAILSMAYWGCGDYEKGFQCVNKALEYYNQSGDIRSKVWMLQILGSFFYDWKDYKQSLAYYQETYDLVKDSGELAVIGRALSGMGNAYLYMDQHKKALNHYEKSLELHRTAGNKYGESRVLNDIGNLCQRKGNFEEALDYHKQSLAIRQEMKYPQGETTSLIDIGSVYTKLDKHDLAIEYLLKALVLVERIKAKPKICRAHEELSRVYRAKGDLEKALDHYHKYHDLEHEIHHDDADKRLHNMRAVYQAETAEREAEIERLKNVELKKKNEELEDTLKKLNATQAQLLQTGKMAALGSLAAGVFHEINTPTGVIKSIADVNAITADKLKKIVDEASDEYSSDENNGAEKLVDILQENARNSINATERIIEIVRSLKAFSRVDESSLQKTDIHSGLESTLTLLSSEVTDRIKITREFDPDLSDIYCYPSELNQVFMNLILNSINAITKKGEITIKTSQAGENISVEITDNGKGIKPEYLDTLFEPGFTTDDQRVKMRTGLYTSYGIIKKHNGDILVKTKSGKGTTFTISLPKELNLHSLPVE